MIMSFSGVISPPLTRGITEKVPLRWILPKKRSFVSWRPLRDLSMMCLLKREARMLPMVGLHSSQPTDSGSLPQVDMTAVNVSSFLT